MKFLFEIETCTRCHGSGKFSYCQDYGDTCFKCRGNGAVLTKRGQVAQAYYVSLCEIPVSEVKIGMRIKVKGMTLGGKPFTYIAPITEIASQDAVRTTVKTRQTDGCGRSRLHVQYSVEYSSDEGFSIMGSSGGTVESDGEEGTFVDTFKEYRITTFSEKYGQKSQIETGKLRVYRDDDEMRRKQALAYQETLTKAGKPRKMGKKLAESQASLGKEQV